MPGVLFIHPDPKLVGIYRRYLEPHVHFDSAYDGVSGLRRLQQMRPHAVISEQRLPSLSGLSILKYVRQHPDLCGTPFIFLSSEPAHQDALRLGANAWLTQQDHGPHDLLAHLFPHLKLN